MANLPEARVRGGFNWRPLARKVALAGVVAACARGLLALSLFASAACVKRSGSKGAAIAACAREYGVPVKDCWGDEDGWECIHLDESWSVARGDSCEHLGGSAKR